LHFEEEGISRVRNVATAVDQIVDMSSGTLARVCKVGGFRDDLKRGRRWDTTPRPSVCSAPGIGANRDERNFPRRHFVAVHCAGA